MRGLWAAALLLLARGALAQTEDPKKAVARHFKNADAYLDDGRPSEAMMELQAAARLMSPEEPGMARFDEKMGTIYLLENDLRMAKDYLEQGIALAEKLKAKGPIVADLYFGFGECLVKEERYADADPYFVKALEAGPSQEKARLIRGRLSRGERAAPVDVSVGPAPAAAKVASIVFAGHRARDWILRRRMPFKEGDTLGPGSLRAARRALLDMGEFSEVTVTSAPTPGGDAAVTVAFEEGWPVAAVPSYLAGSGGSRGAIGLMERDNLRFGEKVYGGAMGGKAGIRAWGGAEWEGFSFNVYEEHHFYTENIYVDGGFTSTQELGEAPAAHSTIKFGAVSGTYLKDINDGGFEVAAALPVEEFVGFTPTAGAGWNYYFVRYDSRFGSVPGGGGFLSKAFLTLRAGSQKILGASGLAGPFTFDEARERRSLAYEVSPRFETGALARVDTAHWYTDSSLRFTYGWARWDSAVTWAREQSLTFSLAGGHGYSLPPPLLFVTGRATGMYGNYAREFRGTSAVGGNISYHLPWELGPGAIEATVFVEGATVFQIDVTENKKGLGGGLSYRFWAYPVPFSVFYTYDVDDRDSQFLFSVGGRF